jgi:hypothetical protein
MGIILPFRQIEGRRMAAAGLAALRSAEIVIFPGVRIERWPGDRPPPCQSAAVAGLGAGVDDFIDPELTD